MNKKERNDLIISWLTISVAFALILSRGMFGSGFFTTVLPIALVGVGTAFIFHELAHRQVAIKFGAQAEFRAWNFGLALAIISAIPVIFTGFGFIFAAPGAVYIYGPHITRRENGLISVAGPLANLIFGSLFFIVSLFLTFGTFWYFVAFYGAMINFFLGFFNMIPFPPLDGSKVIRWDVRAWAVVFFILFFAAFYL